MKNDRFYKNATIIALITAIFTSYNYYKSTHPYQPSCDVNIEYISNTIQDWMRKSVSEKFLKTNHLEVVDINGFAEYKTIPQWNKIALYEDFKRSAVCSATALVDFSPITLDKENTNNEEKNENIKENNHFEKIYVRYQLVKGGGMNMSGFDVEDMTKQIKEAMNKYKKK